MNKSRTKKKHKKTGKVAVEQDARASDEGTEEATEPAVAPDGANSLETAVADKDDRVVLDERIQSLEDSLARAKADYQNLLRRSAQERTEAIRFANAEMARSLLSVVDDFERSLSAVKNADSTEAMKSVVIGIRLVYDNLMRALSANGVEPIQAAGQPFDPMLHEALMQRPSQDHPPNTVLDEISKGYRLHERVIRPTKVVVSTATQEAAAEPDAGPAADEARAQHEPQAPAQE